jgi:hypothetical protein
MSAEFKPTKKYQIWYYTGEGYSFEEFDTQEEVARYLESGVTFGRWFATRLQEFDVYLRDWVPPKAAE